MDVVYTYRVGGGPKRAWCIVVSLDAFPPWATLAQIEHIATYSRPSSTHWLLRSSGKAAACSKFERMLELYNRWANDLLSGEHIVYGRLAPPELVNQLLEEDMCRST